MKTITYLGWGMLACLFLLACSPTTQNKLAEHANSADSTTAHLRPQFHFTPQKFWTNDPNGLLYHDGEFHLFFQHNPYDKVWGHMHWGHAVSNDLLHWEELPIAIAEDTAMIFSGSAVVDKNNTAGFGENAFVAFYTAHRILNPNNPDVYLQTQHLAYSTDKGRTWKKYDQNPIIDLGKKDFRDPKVFWHAESQKWIMAVNLPNEHKTQFYGSTNLKNWELLSEFGPEGNTAIPWECPDLFSLPVENEPGKQKWILLISAEGPYPGFQGMQYFVGDFDGKRFKNDNPADKPLYLDYGRDYFAAVTFNHIPNERRVLLGWLSNWAYANQVPTHPWRNGMAIPRMLYLRKEPDGYRLLQQPIETVNHLAKSATRHLNVELQRVGEFVVGNQEKGGDLYDLEATFEFANDAVFGFKIFKSATEETTIRYDAARKMLYLDRSKSGNVSFSPQFTTLDSVAIDTQGGNLKLRVLFDRNTVEVFAQDGRYTMSNVVFPSEKSRGVVVFAEKSKGLAKLVSSSFRDLKPAQQTRF
ncbi:MAG: glycoside hydrolase family 32 protein [Cytophagales bacterium]|nr:glycoside hydrolase family 32 protein [Bernardetiaceae bacterium]MDW8204002.1 glycoside hydrolase family 32 protein [Cytophagales bacterium]